MRGSSDTAWQQRFQSATIRSTTAWDPTNSQTLNNPEILNLGKKKHFVGIYAWDFPHTWTNPYSRISTKNENSCVYLFIFEIFGKFFFCTFGVLFKRFYYLVFISFVLLRMGMSPMVVATVKWRVTSTNELAGNEACPATVKHRCCCQITAMHRGTLSWPCCWREFRWATGAIAMAGNATKEGHRRDGWRIHGQALNGGNATR